MPDAGNLRVLPPSHSLVGEINRKPFYFEAPIEPVHRDNVENNRHTWGLVLGRDLQSMFVWRVMTDRIVLHLAGSLGFASRRY